VSAADHWKRVKVVFDAALACRLDDRAALVRDLCGGDHELQADVESLLASDAGVGSLFAHPVDGALRGRVFSAVAGVLDDQAPTLQPGHRLGIYEIRGFLGAGGMGRVYQARDTTLGRDVALKILPDIWVADPDRRARFEREARLLASLNHPNIGSIYGVHESVASPESGLPVRALVLELIEGDTLADRITRQSRPTASRRGLPVDEAVSVAGQVIEALEAAHERGIVHRDLKPGNIKITPEGRVKVLDFGLARATSDSSPRIADSPTITIGGTQGGLLLGTAAYMSPEQALGKVVDKRTDVWAFGCVVYEMLAGAPAFVGDGATDVLANVIKSEPDWTALPPDVPTALRLCLERSLQKDPRQRFHDIADVRLAMEGAFEQPVPAAAAPAGERARRQLSAVLALVAVVIGAVGIAVSWNSGNVTVTRLILGWPAGTAPQYNGHFALAPDGSLFVYDGPDRRLWVRDLDELEPRALTGTEDASAPFFSPDSRSVGFVAGRALKVVSVQGGAVRTVIASSTNVLGADWGPDGMLYFSPTATGVWRVAATGGAVEPVSRPDAVGVTHRVMDVLPSGKGALLTIENESVNTSQIGLLDFGTGEVHSLLPGAQARFATSGHVVYTTADGTLRAVPFDQTRLRITGPPIALVENVEVGIYSGYARFALSDNGTLLYQRKSELESEVVWVTKDGTATPLAEAPLKGEFYSLSLSPDARQLAATLTTGTRQDIWTRSLETGAVNRLTFDHDGSLNYRATWTADGRALTYISNRSGTAGELWWQRADGSARGERLVADGPIVDEGLLSPDGRWAVYRAGGSDLVSRDIKAVRLGESGDASPRALVATPSEEYSPALSGDGRWLAYVSQESGRPEVYVRPFPDTHSAVWQVSHGGGQGPVWARNAQQLFYQTLRRELVAVATRGRATFEWDPPHVLFDASSYAFNAWHPIYDVTPDGEKFLMARPVERPVGELVLILNWFDELNEELAGR
jgi:serine/threonine-protein kinase